MPNRHAFPGLMELQHLNNFLAAVEHQSISNAASFIRIAQPALSRQIRSLEDELGCPLLVRHRWGVSPTPAGEVLAEHAREILQKLRIARDAVSAVIQSPSGSIALGVAGSVAGVLLPPLALAARRDLPNVSLRLAEASNPSLQQRLLSGELDMAVIDPSRGLVGVESEDLLWEPIVIAGGPRVFRSGERVRIRDVLRRHAVLAAPSERLRLLYEQAVAAAGAGPTSFVEVDSFAAILELLAEGAGVAMMPFSTIEAGVAGGRLTWADLAPKPHGRRLVLARPQGRIKTPAWRRMADMLREVIDARARRYRWVAPPAA
jgi:LysR family nitrogen assimilation transcriptional regulator